MIRNEPGALSLSGHILEVSLLRIPEALPLTTLWLCSCHLVFFFFLTRGLWSPMLLSFRKPSRRCCCSPRLQSHNGTSPPVHPFLALPFPSPPERWPPSPRCHSPALVPTGRMWGLGRRKAIGSLTQSNTWSFLLCGRKAAWRSGGCHGGRPGLTSHACTLACRLGCRPCRALS